MADRIEVGFKVGIRDALGEKTRKRIIDNLGLPVDKVATIEVYTVTGDIDAAGLEQAAAGPLSDPVIQEYSINRPLAKNFDWLIEVGFRPGVTDNVGKTAREAITLLLGDYAARAKSAFIRPASISSAAIFHRQTQRKSLPAFWPMTSLNAMR